MRRRVQIVDRAAPGKLARLKTADQFACDTSQRQITPEKFMVVPGKIARTGIQEYGAMELGIEGTDRTIRLYRPADEVFKQATLDSFENQAIATGHPNGDVTADNYRDVTSGVVYDVAKSPDGKTVDAMLKFMDSWAIQNVIDGQDQLSCGYSFALDMTPGTSPEGEAYDGVMRDIVGNHVAHVWNARGGPALRVADTTPARTNIMKIRIKDSKGAVITSFDLDDKIGDSVERSIQDALDRHDKALMDCMAAHDAVKTERDVLKAKVAETQANYDAAATDAKKKLGDAAVEIEKLRAQIVTPEQQAARDEARAKLIGDVKPILGEAFDGKGKTEAQIRVAALDHVMTTDGPAKNVAKAVLGGTEPSKASEKDITVALDAVLGLGLTSARASDAALRAFAPAAGEGRGFGRYATRSASASDEMSPQELFEYRETHGGKSPAKQDRA